MKTTNKDIMRDLAGIESDYFLKQLQAFDYKALQVPYKDVLADRELPYRDRKYENYNNSGESLYLYRMGHDKARDLVVKTIKQVSAINRWGFPLKSFKSLLDSYPPAFRQAVVDWMC